MKKLFLAVYCIGTIITAAFSQNISGDQKRDIQFVPENFEDNFCLIQTGCLTLKEANQAAESIHRAGGRIAVIGSPEFMIGWIPAGTKKELIQNKNIRAIYTTAYSEKKINRSPASAAIIDYFNSVMSGEILKNESEAGQNYFTPNTSSCVKTEDKTSRSICEKDKNSEYMKGSVSCGVFFVESSGASDPNTYTWTSANIANIKAQILDAFSIWSYTASQNAASVTFTPVWYEAPSTVISQPYEPILHSSDQDGLWITSILANLGYNVGDKFIDCHNYNWDLRNANGTDWAYATFVINNPSPAATSFTNGTTSYAYRGGPYTNLLIRASGWPMSTFFRAFGHESAHIFYAFDEYSSSSPNNCTYSFNAALNINYHGSTCNGALSCVMVDNVYFGTGTTRQWYLCNPTKTHIGWQNLAPVPTLVSPVNNVSVPPGTVDFTWNRNTSNTSVNSAIRVVDTLGNIMDCSVLGVNSNAQIFLPTGVYRWQAINGTDLWNGGYAEVSSPVYNLYVGLAGVEESYYELPVTIFPNPAADQITIQNLQPGINRIEIYDIPGHKIFSEEVIGLVNKNYTVNIKGLAKGFYLVSIMNNNRKKVTKLLIQ